MKNDYNSNSPKKTVAPKHFALPEAMGGETPLNEDEKKLKAVAGTYFERAMNNAAQTLRYIFNNKLQLTPTPDFKDLEKTLRGLAENSALADPLKHDEFRKLVFHHIPLFKALEDYRTRPPKPQKGSFSQPKEVRKLYSAADILIDLADMVGALNHYRNTYTHANHSCSQQTKAALQQREGEIAKWMENVFDSAVRMTKERCGFSADQMKFLQCGFGSRRKRDGKKFVLNDQFFFALTRNGLEVTPAGRLFLCCCFLPSHYVWDFLGRVNLERTTPFDQNQRDILSRALNVFHLRLPQENRIESDTSEGGLLLDVFAELGRCPLREVFDHISPQGQKQFRPKPDDRSPDGEEVLLARYDDRFPQLALRLIDQLGILDLVDKNGNKKEGIRFQQRLGSFRFRFYDKRCVDGASRLRTLQKEINGFGKWHELESRRRSRWAGIIRESAQPDQESEGGFAPDTADSQPYVTDCAPRYNIHNNRIGMTWGLDDGLFLPDLPKAAENPGSVAVEQPVPKCSMSIFDLPALLFYRHLIFKKGNIANLATPAKVIQDCCNNLHELFELAEQGASPDALKKFAVDKGIADSSIPVRLLNYINGNPCGPQDRLAAHAAQVLQEVVELCENRLDQLKEAQKCDIKYGKKGCRQVRYGHMAQYLGKSIMRWQPPRPGGQNKLTGLNYQTLVKALATSGQSWNDREVNQLFQKSELLGSDHPHPFLAEALRGTQNLGHFYSRYLAREKTFALKMKAELEARPAEALRQVPFAKPDAAKWKDCQSHPDYIKDYARRLLHTPAGGKETPAILLLPDGLFDAHVRKAITAFLPNTELCQMANEKVPGNNEKVPGNECCYKYGISKLIAQYFEQVQNDYAQPFYNADMPDFGRAYSLTTKLYGQKVGNSHQPYYMNSANLKTAVAKCGAETVRRAVDMKAAQTEESAKRKLRSILNNEKAIRRLMTQDKVLFLTAKELLYSLLTHEWFNYYTKPANTSVLQQINSVQLQSADSDFLRQCSQIIGDDQLPTFRFKLKNSDVTITQENLSLRNMGNVYRVQRDPRWQTLQKLLEKLEQTEVQYGAITAEFKNHEENSVKAVELSQRLEHEAYSDAIGRGETIDEETSHNFRKLLVCHPTLSKYQCDEIVLVRNKFNHNQYVDPSISKDKIFIERNMNGKKVPNLAKAMYETMKEAVEHPEDIIRKEVGEVSGG